MLSRVSVPALFSTPGVSPPIRRELENVDWVPAGRFSVPERVGVRPVLMTVAPPLALMAPEPVVASVPPDQVNLPATLTTPEPPICPDSTVRLVALPGWAALQAAVPPVTSTAPSESGCVWPAKVVVPPEKRVTPVKLYPPENVPVPPVNSTRPAPVMLDPVEYVPPARRSTAPEDAMKLPVWPPPWAISIVPVST